MGFGQPLDAILKDRIINGPETIAPTYTSRAIRIDNREDAFSIQLVYSNGVAVNMTLTLEISTDGVNFSPITDINQAITDPSGSHIWDIDGTGTNFCRVVITGTGTIDIDLLEYSGFRRH